MPVKAIQHEAYRPAGALTAVANAGKEALNLGGDVVQGAVSGLQVSFETLNMQGLVSGLGARGCTWGSF